MRNGSDDAGAGIPAEDRHAAEEAGERGRGVNADAEEHHAENADDAEDANIELGHRSPPARRNASSDTSSSLSPLVLIS